MCESDGMELRELFFLKFIYLFLAASGLSCGRGIFRFCARASLFSSCGMQVFLFSSCGTRAPGHVGSVVVARGFQSAWAL